MTRSRPNYPYRNVFLDLLIIEPKKGPKDSTSPVASWTLLRPQLNNLPGFGMEPPAGIAQDGYAECVRLNTVPPTVNRMPDADCETEVFTTDSALGAPTGSSLTSPSWFLRPACKAFQAASCLPVGGQQVRSRNMEFRKSRPRGATGEYFLSHKRPSNIKFEIRRIRFHEPP